MKGDFVQVTVNSFLVDPQLLAFNGSTDCDFGISVLHALTVNTLRDEVFNL